MKGVEGNEAGVYRNDVICDSFDFLFAFWVGMTTMERSKGNR